MVSECKDFKLFLPNIDKCKRFENKKVKNAYKSFLSDISVFKFKKLL